METVTQTGEARKTTRVYDAYMSSVKFWASITRLAIEFSFEGTRCDDRPTRARSFGKTLVIVDLLSLSVSLRRSRGKEDHFELWPFYLADGISTGLLQILPSAHPNMEYSLIAVVIVQVSPRWPFLAKKRS